MEQKRLTAGFILRRVVRGFLGTQSADAAAGLSFYGLLAMFPTLIAAFSVIGLFGEKRGAARAVLDALGEVLAPDTIDALREPIQAVAKASGAGWVLVVSLTVALWSVARYITALGHAMNRIYGVPEGRPLWKAKPVHLLLTAVVFVLVLAAAGLAAISWPLAQFIGAQIGAGETALTVWRVLRWPAVVLLVMLVIALLYYFAPNVQHPRFRWISIGAAIALLVLALASTGFAFYVSRLADYDRVYGSFAGVVILLLWLWIANMALLVGALFDAEIERARELKVGEPAERSIQLPLRDTERIANIARHDVEDERTARRIRES
ncbi:YihY/virulence factor BrkB family protein [Microbacterium sp.]|uniref:YihY/virulence factor BrkB family protein n=1 Tax=Microbacterium sp. TaxID=51671 RepID=UPI0028114B7B|nr:YihY/virulence factor BrkB family protein [Microbacterium sp.]